jgi:formate--tetrahydrofolate ligase
MEPIGAIARSLGIEPKHLIAYGDDKAKVSLAALKATSRGKLIAITGITPTSAGEGKTTTAIGLTDALAKAGHKAVVTLRQPSLGPMFGIKGGGTGGGWATVVPEADINLHFTGDSHAVTTAHNLLAALVDNAARRHLINGLAPDGITWRRVSPIEDRALRQIATGLGGDANGPVRETGFDITEASEIMAILSLATGYEDLRKRLGAITIGTTNDGRPVRAGEIGAVGSMMALLKDAMLPNLVQTGAGQPALIHTGPFANIAHGASSVIADKLALGYADYVVTECGFGADLGFEKFMHIKMRSSGLRPAAVVLVATVRAIKSHGGVPADALTRPDAMAVRIGAANLEHMVKVVKSFGVPVVVSINRFPTDTAEEIVILQDVAITAGASAAVTCSAFTDGATGAAELAEAVERLASNRTRINYLYDEDAGLRDKIYAIATKVYGATSVTLTRDADRKLDHLDRQGHSDLPICMAKTAFSLSHDPLLKNRPTQYSFEITDIRASTGAGFIYPIAGNIVTMPGLPTHPRQLDLDRHNQVTGLG